MAAELGRYVGFKDYLTANSNTYCFNLTVDFQTRKKRIYGELEAFQKSKKITKIVDITLNNCSFTWT